jgi:hypothetical protein
MQWRNVRVCTTSSGRKALKQTVYIVEERQKHDATYQHHAHLHANGLQAGWYRAA